MTKRFWGWALAALGIGGATAIIVYEVRKPAPAPPAQTPIWAPLAPAADGSFTIPAGSSFGVSSLVANPNTPNLAADLAAAQAAGSVSPTVGVFPAPAGTIPAGWPKDDNGGTAAMRWSGAATSAVTLPAADANGASVWIVTGFSS